MMSPPWNINYRVVLVEARMKKRNGMAALDNADTVESPRMDARLAGFSKVLVLTVGFGIGAALIQRSAGQ